MNNSVKRRKPRTRAPGKKKKWSGAVNRKSDALDLEQSIFKSASPARIARSLKKSAESSRRRKSGPYQSAMSMLNFYINRGGSNLPATRKRVLERAKAELRKAFHREG
jgi:hypothetical protein